MLVTGVGRAELDRALGQIDGRRTLAELRVRAGRDRPALERLLAQTLGLVSFVPGAISALESALPGTEIVRFPGAPYELVRAYWTNMASVRRLAESSLDDFRGPDASSLLRRLHVVLLLGENLETFYRPASRITRGGVRPGALYTSEARHVSAGETRLLLSGPRVGVGFAGGERYHRALAEAASDLDSLLPERTIQMDGLDWGSVLTGRSVDDERDAAWFCPPRPLTDAHFEAVFSAFNAALAAEHSASAIRELACFHYRFVRLHPFRCANQSLAMNLLNLVLVRICGAGMPHLLLDQLALRFNEPAYTRIFELAVAEYSIAGEPRERWRLHREKKALAYALIESLKHAANVSDIEALLRSDPRAARAALILA